MKKMNKITRRIAAMLAAVITVSTFAAVSASASDAENNEMIAAAKANTALLETWEDVDNAPANEDEIDRVFDLLERLEITADCYDGEDKNSYSNDDGTLTHEQVMEIIRSASPEGCIKNPFDLGNYTEADSDDDGETLCAEEDTDENSDDEADGESFFDIDLDLGGDFLDQLFGKN